MMDMEVKQILKSSCFRYGWSYAVFWRNDPIDPMLLRVKETHNDEQSAAFVDDMILQTHILGQGIVGEAALTGNYQWLFSDTMFQCEHEFQNQFLSGIKSIAIIPVGSSCVVQLGSTQKIVESREMVGETRRALKEMKPEQPVMDLDSLFESLVPLGSSEIAPPPDTYSFDDIFTEEDSNLPFLLSPISENSPPLNHSSSDINGDDDSVFDILNSYSLDDLYQLLADSPEQNCSSGGDHQESSMVIQGNDKDLFDLLGIHSHDSPPPQKGLFSELISTSLSNSNSTSCLTNVQEDSYSYGLNQSKRRRLDTSTSSSFFMTQAEETLTPPPLNPPLWIDEDRSSVSGNWKKPQEEGVKKKKREKGGESRKPRPKDRQMIQDRIKELRAMIPNGAKCSIDTLLDLTIRHMVFMQSLAKYADQLKQPYEPKLVKGKERTWALEVGDDDESVVCPIIVEDLKPQGQMQIEMVCHENGDDQFLEIANVVRGLGLNILKGVMETRQGKIWAHLIVEAKPQQHVTRLQLFYSLVHLFHSPSSESHHQT